ncbi:18595_t:CDS:2, partial [Racocetra persica]
MAGQNQDINLSTVDGSQKNDQPQNTQMYPPQSAQDTQQHPPHEPQDAHLYPPHNVWENPPQLSYNQPYEQYNPQYQQPQQQLNVYDNNPFYGHSQMPSGSNGGSGIANTYDPNYNQGANAYNPNYNPFQNQNFNTYDSTNPYANAYSSSTDMNAYSTATETNAYSSPGDNENKNSSTTTHSETVVEKKENSDDNNVSVGLAAAVNPGVETSDPSKMNPTEEPKKKHIPSGKRFFFRLFILLASAGALGFIIGAPLYSKQEMPKESNKWAIYFVYVVSGLSIIVSLYFLVLYCFRRYTEARKIPRILLHLIDFVFAASFGVLMVFMIKDFTCPIGGRGG